MGVRRRAEHGRKATSLFMNARRVVSFSLAVLSGFLSLLPHAFADSRLADAAERIRSDDPTVQMAAVMELRDLGDPASLPLLRAMEEGAAYRWEFAPGIVRLVVVDKPVDEQGVEWLVLREPISGEVLSRLDGSSMEALAQEEHLSRLSLPSADARRLVKSALERLKLFDADPAFHRAAATKIGNEEDDSALPVLLHALEKEKDRWARHALHEAVHQIRLQSPDPQVRRKSAEELGRMIGLQALSRMKGLLNGELKEKDPAVRAALESAVRRIEGRQGLSIAVGTVFNGISLGSILLMMGLGLAITFGLMGVINMAHGEMMMIGGYVGFVLQEWFAAHLPPAMHDHYFLAALPVSFMVAGAVGWALEKSVIRFLYGRPLETLLATWGVSMIFQQAARVYFGDLTGVNAPSWLRGGVEPMVGLVLPYGRIFIMGLGGLTLFGIHVLLTKTPLGLRIRAVTQNRDMSACLGISTRRVDGWTFALGAGLAGLAGCSLNLIGTVDPEVGKYYIVESFMVVVVGGVGKLAGTLAAALGIGVTTKILEPLIGGTGGSIYAKLAILGAIILFLQRRPSGIFAPKGRLVEKDG
ncbi:MAG: urea ABC transporter permease subunit UrtB [Nitrospirae bacterium]|nr:urea ABC transporter permease subunit UrtB [Nitrospirota bacterium]